MLCSKHLLNKMVRAGANEYAQFFKVWRLIPLLPMALLALMFRRVVQISVWLVFIY